MRQEEQEIIDQLNSNGISISEEAACQLFSFYEALVKKNEEMNLTAITEFQDVVVKHFLDSLLLLPAMSQVGVSAKGTYLDIGTGAGFPGIPLKILLPNEKFVLLDSLQKRISFLEEVKEKLHLSNIDLIHGRAEDFVKAKSEQKKSNRESFDFVVSRAVANLSSLSEYALPFVKIGGYFIAYKSGDCAEELEEAKFAIQVLGGKVQDVYKVDLPNGAGSRAFVFIRKENMTPSKYPRKAGTPTKEPLHQVTSDKK